MKFKYLIILTLVCLKEIIALKKDTGYCTSNLSLSSSKLIMVQIIFRHGARNIIKMIPGDIYHELDFIGGLGELTAEGKEQEYNLGVWLRKRYASLFKNEHPEKSVYCETSIAPRVIASARYCIAGLLPKTKNQTYHENIINEWKPIEPHSIKKDDDIMIAGSKDCPEYTNQKIKYKKSPEYLKYLKDYKKIMNDLSKHVGVNITTLSQAADIYDALKTEKHQGRPLIDWARNQTLYKKLGEIAVIQFKSHTGNTELARLRGFLLKRILEQFQHNINTGHYKFIMYAGHDYTVTCMLNSLGLFNDVLPPFGACLMFELHEFEGKYYLKIFYREDDSKKRYTIAKVTSARLLCECLLDDFKQNNEDVLPTKDPNKECISKGEI